MASEPTPLTESEVSAMLARAEAMLHMLTHFKETRLGERLAICEDNASLARDWRRLRIALHDLLHCDVCDNEGILFSEDNQPYPCDCRVNAKRALGEE